MRLTRDIPVPTSVSPRAQAVMEAGCEGVPDRLANPPDLPARNDVEGWRERIRVTDELMVFAFADRVDQSRFHYSDKDVAGVHVVEIVPDSAPDAPVLLDIHGGALVGGGGEAGRLMSSISAQRTGLRTWAVDYRMPPDHPYPAPLDDCLAVYRTLLSRTPAEHVVVAGASAGGNLAAAMLLLAREEGLPMPAALVLLSPEVDLTESGDTFATNVGVDYARLDGLGESIPLSAGDHDPTDL